MKILEIGGYKVPYEIKRKHKFFHHPLTAQGLTRCNCKFEPVGYYKMRYGPIRYSYRCSCMEVDFID